MPITNANAASSPLPRPRPVFSLFSIRVRRKPSLVSVATAVPTYQMGRFCGSCVGPIRPHPHANMPRQRKKKPYQTHQKPDLVHMLVAYTGCGNCNSIVRSMARSTFMLFFFGLLLLSHAPPSFQKLRPFSTAATGPQANDAGCPQIRRTDCCSNGDGIQVSSSLCRLSAMKLPTLVAWGVAFMMAPSQGC